MNFTDVRKNPKEIYTVDTPGKHVFFLYNHSGNVTVDIAAQNAQVYIYGLFIGHKKEIYTVHTVQHHMQKNSLSDLFIKGVFFDESKLMYEGLIRLEKEAQQSHAYQKNQNLMMSQGCFVDSRPFLEILANDVFCTHGSTTGRLDKNQLHYLQSRGLTESRAKDLLVKGFINDVGYRLNALGVTDAIKEYFSFE